MAHARGQHTLYSLGCSGRLHSAAALRHGNAPTHGTTHLSIERLVTCSQSLAGTWAEGRFEAALLYLRSPQLVRAGHQQQPPAFPPALAAWRLAARARHPLAPRASAAPRQQAGRRGRQTTRRQKTRQRARRMMGSHRWCSRRRRRRATQRGTGAPVTAAPVTAMGRPLVAMYRGVQCANRNRGVRWQCAAAAAPLATAAAYIGDDAAVGERGARARLALAVVPAQG